MGILALHEQAGRQNLHEQGWANGCRKANCWAYLITTTRMVIITKRSAPTRATAVPVISATALDRPELLE